MLKIDYPFEILESESALRTLYQHASHIKIKERLEVLIWLKSGQVSTMKTAAELKRRSKTWGNNLWKTYKNEGISGYCTLHNKPQESPLVNKKALSEQLSSDGFASIKEAREWIARTYQIDYTENGLGNYFRRRKIKLKTARPHHPQKDEKQRADYKKI